MTDQTSTHISPDGQFQWNGTEWVPIAEGPVATEAAAAPKKKSRKGFYIVGAAVAAICALGVTAAVAFSDSPEAAAASVGDTVNDGDFSFTVTDVETGVDEVGEDPFTDEAEGSYTLVTVTVKNISDETHDLMDQVVVATDSEGNTLTLDPEATAYATDDVEALTSDVKPGGTVTYTLAFDVADGAEVESVEVHDSPLSGGATIDVAED